MTDNRKKTIYILASDITKRMLSHLPPHAITEIACKVADLIEMRVELMIAEAKAEVLGDLMKEMLSDGDRERLLYAISEQRAKAGT